MAHLSHHANLLKHVPERWRTFATGCLVPLAAVSITAAPLPLMLRGIVGILFLPMLLLDVAFQWLGAPVSIMSDAHPRRAWLVANILLILTMILYGFIAMAVAPLFRTVPQRIATILNAALVILSAIGLAYLAMESMRYL